MPISSVGSTLQEYQKSQNSSLNSAKNKQDAFNDMFTEEEQDFLLGGGGLLHGIGKYEGNGLKDLSYGANMLSKENSGTFSSVLDLLAKVGPHTIYIQASGFGSQSNTTSGSQWAASEVDRLRDSVKISPEQRRWSELMSKFEKLYPDWVNITGGANNYRVIQQRQRVVQERIEAVQKQFGLDGDFEIDINLQSKRITATVPGDTPGYLKTAFEEALNQDFELKEQLWQAATATKIANGEGNDVFYSQFDGWLQENFDQSLDDLKCDENGELSGMSPRLEALISGNMDDAIGWAKGLEGAGIASIFGPRTGEGMEMADGSTHLLISGGETGRSMKQMLAVLVTEGEGAGESMKYAYNSGKLATVDMDLPTGEGQLTDEQNESVEFFRQFGGASFGMAFINYSNRYRMMFDQK